MTETSHVRSRRAALLGLILQALVSVAAYALHIYVQSIALYLLACFCACGVPIWFALLLVFRQHELAGLEELDLQELRREKQAVGGEGLFAEEGGGGLGFRVAAVRLEWMQRWLLPILGLVTAAALAGVGFWQWNVAGGGAADRDKWLPLVHSEVGLILTTLIALALFFFARYAAGLARVREWQMLRAGGSYMLASSLVAAAVMVALAIHLYQRTDAVERSFGFVVPWLMALLAAEIVLNFLLDIYRPKSPGTQARVCFDSRLIGLISEPGGIAKSLADALNYQFGFEVSQTWFYQLLQRTLLPLAVVGVIVLWLLSAVVVIQPYERGVVEHFGRQVNAEQPLESGLHFKRPWPWATVTKLNTDQLHQFMVGYETGEAPIEDPKQAAPLVELWTDEKHGGRKHFEFLISPPPERGADARQLARLELGQDEAKKAPVHMIRLLFVVQYKLRPDELDLFTRATEDPHELVRNMAWNEVERYVAAADVDQLMGPLRDEAGAALHARLQALCDREQLGLEIAYVGLLHVHPETSVAESFRAVVDAQQKKIAEIRAARVTESEILSEVAGNPNTALALAHAIDKMNHYTDLSDEVRDVIRAAGQDAQLAAQMLEPSRPVLQAGFEAELKLERAERNERRAAQDLELGAGTTASMRHAQTALELAQVERESAAKSAEESLRPVRESLARTHGDELARALLDACVADFGLRFWIGQTARQLEGLEGKAAVTLSQALAKRWEVELTTAGELTRLLNERVAYRAAPELYKRRRYLQALAGGMRAARKYFLAFEPGDRTIRLRLEMQEQARPDIESLTGADTGN